MESTYRGAVDSLLSAFGAGGAEAAVAAETEEDVCVNPDDITGQSGGSFCEGSDSCYHLEPGEDENFNTGTFVGDGPIDVFVIKAGLTYHILTREGPDDGCMSALFGANWVFWEKSEYEGPNCKDVSHVQAWTTALCP
jgi:hypothetical protein